MTARPPGSSARRTRSCFGALAPQPAQVLIGVWLLVRFARRLGGLRGGLQARVGGGGDRGLLDLGPGLGLRLLLVLAGEGGDVVGVEVEERLVGRQPAVARGRQRRVRATAAGREDRVAPAVEDLLVAVLAAAVGLRELGLGLDVDAPAR